MSPNSRSDSTSDSPRDSAPEDAADPAADPDAPPASPVDRLLAATPELPGRLRPWHGVMLVVFCVGAAGSVTQTNLDSTAGFGPEAIFLPTLSGLLAVVVFQFTVGNVWGYAVEYRNAGGRWSDWAFLAPVLLTALAGAAVAAVRLGDDATLSSALVAGGWAAFWVFVACAAVLYVATWLRVGYREGRADPERE